MLVLRREGGWPSRLDSRGPKPLHKVADAQPLSNCVRRMLDSAGIYDVDFFFNQRGGERNVMRHRDVASGRVLGNVSVSHVGTAFDPHR